jgi:hypothetical protein
MFESNILGSRQVLGMIASIDSSGKSVPNWSTRVLWDSSNRLWSWPFSKAALGAYRTSVCVSHLSRPIPPRRPLLPGLLVVLLLPRSMDAADSEADWGPTVWLSHYSSFHLDCCSDGDMLGQVAACPDWPTPKSSVQEVGCAQTTEAPCKGSVTSVAITCHPRRSASALYSGNCVCTAGGPIGGL